MAEVGKVILNLVGGVLFIMGILANLNNWISIVLGILGVIFGVIKAFHAVENYRIRKIQRLVEEREYNEKYIKKPE